MNSICYVYYLKKEEEEERVRGRTEAEEGKYWGMGRDGWSFVILFYFFIFTF